MPLDYIAKKAEAVTISVNPAYNSQDAAVSRRIYLYWFPILLSKLNLTQNIYLIFVAY